MSYTPHKWERHEERGKEWVSCAACGKVDSPLAVGRYGDHCPGEGGTIDLMAALKRSLAEREAELRRATTEPEEAGDD